MRLGSSGIVAMSYSRREDPKARDWRCCRRAAPRIAAAPGVLSPSMCDLGKMQMQIPKVEIPKESARSR